MFVWPVICLNRRMLAVNEKRAHDRDEKEHYKGILRQPALLL